MCAKKLLAKAIIASLLSTSFELFYKLLLNIRTTLLSFMTFQNMASHITLAKNRRLSTAFLLEICRQRFRLPSDGIATKTQKKKKLTLVHMLVAVEFPSFFDAVPAATPSLPNLAIGSHQQRTFLGHSPSLS